MREIEKFKIDKGYIVYKMSNIDAIGIFNGFGICDDCSSSTRVGYYVPVLNHYMCEDCFNEWQKVCIYYEEDLWFQSGNVKIVDNIINYVREVKLIDKTKV